MQPKLSIMVPVYNQADLLLEALNSIPKRNDIEVLIIDDCSTDNTWEVMSNWRDENLEKFAAIRLKKNSENMGCGYSKNWAYRAAQGEYIVTLDSDDYFYTRVFNDIVEQLYNHSEDMLFINNNINSGTIWKDESRKATWSYIIKNSFLREHNLNYSPTARRAGDYELTKEIVKLNPTRYHFEGVPYHYNYPREGSIVWNHEHGITN